MGCVGRHLEHLQHLNKLAKGSQSRCASSTTGKNDVGGWGRDSADGRRGEAGWQAGRQEAGIKQDRRQEDVVWGKCGGGTVQAPPPKQVVWPATHCSTAAYCSTAAPHRRETCHLFLPLAFNTPLTTHLSPLTPSNNRSLFPPPDRLLCLTASCAPPTPTAPASHRHHDEIISLWRRPRHLHRRYVNLPHPLFLSTLRLDSVARRADAFHHVVICR